MYLQDLKHCIDTRWQREIEKIYESYKNQARVMTS